MSHVCRTFALSLSHTLKTRQSDEDALSVFRQNFLREFAASDELDAGLMPLLLLLLPHCRWRVVALSLSLSVSPVLMEVRFD